MRNKIIIPVALTNHLHLCLSAEVGKFTSAAHCWKTLSYNLDKSFYSAHLLILIWVPEVHSMQRALPELAFHYRDP
jgi:hypothetical protein